MKSLIGKGLFALSLAAAPASAATFVNTGDSHIIFFDGYADGVVSGLTSKLTLTFNGFTNSGKLANFSYLLENSSSAPVTAARLSSFGWDVETPTFSFAGSTDASSIFD